MAAHPSAITPMGKDLDSAELSAIYSVKPVVSQDTFVSKPHPSQAPPYPPPNLFQASLAPPPNPFQAAVEAPPNPFQAYLEAPHTVSAVRASNPSPDGLNSRSKAEIEAEAKREEPARLVHADIIDLDDIKMCKRSSGEDWLLGRGSYGMVSPALYLGLPMALVFCLPLALLYWLPWPLYSVCP